MRGASAQCLQPQLLNRGPDPALYLRLGKELARTLLLGGSHVSPTVLEASGYEFTDPELEPALQRMLKG